MQLQNYMQKINVEHTVPDYDRISKDLRYINTYYALDFKVIRHKSANHFYFKGVGGKNRYTFNVQFCGYLHSDILQLNVYQTKEERKLYDTKREVWYSPNKYRNIEPTVKDFIQCIMTYGK